MPVPAHHALLDAPGIGAHFQHVEIVIRFEQQNLHAPQVNPDGIGHISEVRSHADFDAFGMKTETDRVDSVVRDGEALYRDVAQYPAGARLKLLYRGRRFHSFPFQQRSGQARHIHANRLLLFDAPANEARQTRNMIRVLMRDQHRVDVFRFLADFSQPARQIFHAETRIDQNTRLRRGEKRRVPGAAAREYAESDDYKSPT